MADRHKILPLDAEPRSSSAPAPPPPYVLLKSLSEKFDYKLPPQPPYVLLKSFSEKTNNKLPSALLAPPPDELTGVRLTQPWPPRKRRRSCWCKCLCWTLLAIIIVVLLLGATVGILYLIFHPKIPKYSLDRLTVSNFTIKSTTAAATFNLTITATNPNKNIGIYYLAGSSLSVWFNDYDLCSGSLPEFYQGHQNTTEMAVLLAGEIQLGGQLLTELEQEEQLSGALPLVLQGKVPVKLKLGKLKLMKITFKVRCDLVVKGFSLTKRNSVKISSSTCKYKLKL